MLPQFDLVDFLIAMLVLVFSIAIHEFAHAWSAMRLGDRTAYYQGRVTLNPAVHLDPMGTMMMVFTAIAGAGFGWGKPVPVNPYNLRYGPRIGMALTAAAGPISNILQAIVWGIPLRLYYGGSLTLPEPVRTVLWAGLLINIGLALFNLIPLYPLDGFSVLRGALATIRTRWAEDLIEFMERTQLVGPIVLMGLVFFGQGILGMILWGPRDQLARLILGV